MPKKNIGNSENKCYYCKRAEATHQAKLNHEAVAMEIKVCKRCSVKLKMHLGAEVWEIVDPRTEAGKERNV